MYLDEEGDFVLACLRTCKGNLWETILGCTIQDDILAGVAVLAALSPLYLAWWVNFWGLSATLPV